MDTIQILKALADDTRLNIVRHLASQNEPVASKHVVTSCSEALKLSQPTLSHHLGLLEDAGVVTTFKIGRQKYYSLHKTLLTSIGINSEQL